MSMKSYLNAASAPNMSRRVALSVGTGFERYRDNDDYEPARAEAAAMAQSTPSWLVKGLQQYLDLRDSESGDVGPRDPDEHFGHLAASVQSGKPASFFEVTSDALYIPSSVEKVGRAALKGEDCFVIQTSFSFGVGSGETPAVKPRFTLDLVKIDGDEVRADIIEAARAKGHREVRLREDDLLDDSGDLRSLVRVKSGITKPKTNPRVSGPVVREQEDDSWVVPRYSGNAAGGLLKAFLSPVLDEQIQRVKIDGPIPKP